MTSKIQDADQGLRGYALHTRRHTHVLLPPHPHTHSNISSIVLIKKTLGVPDSGVHQPCCSEHIPPRQPLTRTHMYGNADTQRRPWTHSHGQKPPCAASPASAHVLAPPRAFFRDCSLCCSGARLPQGGAQATSTSAPF